MTDQTEITRIDVRVRFLDTPYYREYEVDSINDFSFNDAGTLLWVQQNSPVDEPDVSKKAVLIPVHRIQSVDVRYYGTTPPAEPSGEQDDVSTATLLLRAGYGD